MVTSPKRQRRKSWVKLWVTGWLHGSIRWQLTPEERSVWADLLALAGECAADGAIQDHDGEALPRKFIANQFNIPQVLLDRVIAKCIHDGRLEQGELDGIIKLTNWEHYQSEYDRQKPWREAHKEQPVRQEPEARQPARHEPVIAAPEPPRSRWQILCAKLNYPDVSGALTPAETKELETLKAERVAQGAAMKAKLETTLDARRADADKKKEEALKISEKLKKA